MRLLSLLDDEKEEEMERQKTRLKKLHEIAMKGTVTPLLELIHEDPLILTTTTTPSYSVSDSPLHLASLLGHSAFAKELLNQNPQLAGQLNSHGSSPLHLASAKGYVEIVKDLLLANPDMCFVLDRDGRTPLHLGAIKGRVAVLTELIRVKPEAVRVLTSGGETSLHLCLKYNRLEAFKFLVESMGMEEKDDFVKWRDREGNTVLHVAVARKQMEIIKFLLTSTAIEINAQNAHGYTALDVLSQSPRDLRDMEIKENLRHAGASRIEDTIAYSRDIVDVYPMTQPQAADSSSKQEAAKHKHTDWLGRKRSALMIVASLIATVAFQSSLSPPGGVWQDDYLVDSNGNPVKDPHNAGKSVMAYGSPTDYGKFLIFNTIAFLSSLSIILLLVSGLPLKRRGWMWSQMVTTWIAITALTATYILALIHMTPNDLEGISYQITKYSALVWLALFGIVCIGNIVRMILWLLRKYGYMKEKQREHKVYEEEDENDEL